MNRCSPPYARGSGMVCGCNTRCCPPPICNRVKALFTFFSSAACNEITIYETDVRCENGQLNIYTRSITLTLRDWEIYNIQEDCCTPPTSSSASGSSDIVVDCCPDPIPSTLTASITNSVDCSCIEGNVTLIWDAGTTSWNGTTNCLGDEVDIRFFCDTGTFSMTVTCQNGSSDTFGLSGACDPFSFSSGPKVLPNNCCPGGGSVEIVVTV